MISHHVRKYVSFKCHSCQGKAQLTEVDGRLDRVECLVCNIWLDTDTANAMYQTLIKQRIIQEGRNFNRRLLRDRGMRNVPLTKVDNEFSDPEWPFILVIEGDA